MHEWLRKRAFTAIWCRNDRWIPSCHSRCLGWLSYVCIIIASFDVLGCFHLSSSFDYDNTEVLFLIHPHATVVIQISGYESSTVIEAIIKKYTITHFTHSHLLLTGYNQQNLDIRQSAACFQSWTRLSRTINMWYKAAYLGFSSIMNFCSAHWAHQQTVIPHAKKTWIVSISSRQIYVKSPCWMICYAMMWSGSVMGYTSLLLQRHSKKIQNLSKIYYQLFSWSRKILYRHRIWQLYTLNWQVSRDQAPLHRHIFDV